MGRGSDGETEERQKGRRTQIRCSRGPIEEEAMEHMGKIRW